MGRAEVQVKFKQFNSRLPLTIVEKDCPSLLGVEWFKHLSLDIVGPHQINSGEMDDLLAEFRDVFDGKLGNYKGKPSLDSA